LVGQEHEEGRAASIGGALERIFLETQECEGFSVGGDHETESKTTVGAIEIIHPQFPRLGKKTERDAEQYGLGQARLTSATEVPGWQVFLAT